MAAAHRVAEVIREGEKGQASCEGEALFVPCWLDVRLIWQWLGAEWKTLVRTAGFLADCRQTPASSWSFPHKRN